ncbi:MAG TPA: aminotransferase class V-fold PLP-dependent enzyme [Gaiellaceae bacterium]|nr:aminotransferase class V-fold PLP-dependent enzyme [Gaiellaceae bacterium]
MSWPEARARFPVLEQHAYLNAGTFGPLSRATLDAIASVRAWEGMRGRVGKAHFDEMLARRDRVRALLAEQINVPAENVAITDSTTQGVHIVLAGLGLGPGDEVVTTDAEHFGLSGPLIASGAKLRIARVRDAPAADVFGVIEAEVTPQTRLIATSAVSWIDGKVFPWHELRDATQVPVLVDGAQAAGAIEIDATGADFFTVSAQKWLCGPDATGALYVAEPEELAPRLVAYPGAEAYDIAAGTWTPKPGAQRFEPSFTPASSLAGLEAALTDLPEGRFARARDLAERCRELLLAEGHDVATEPGQATLVSFHVAGDAAAASAALYERGVIVRDLPNTNLLRASIGWWNDGSDLERLVEGLAAWSSITARSEG